MKERRIKVGAEEALPDLETGTERVVKEIDRFRKGVDAMNTEFSRHERDLAGWIRKILGRKVKELVDQEPAYVIVEIPQQVSESRQPFSLKQIFRELRERSSPDLVGEVLMEYNQYIVRDDGKTYFELYRGQEKTEEGRIRYELSDSDLIDLGPLLESQLNDALTGKQKLTALVRA